MTPSILTSSFLLLAGTLSPLWGQASGTPTGWRYPQCSLAGGSFYPYPSPELVNGPFELITKWSVPADLAFTGDVNGDGKLELVAQAGSRVFVYSGTRVLLSSAAVAGGIRIGALQDVNGDKIDDILLAGRVNDELKVVFLRGNGKVIRRFSLKAKTITPLDQTQSTQFGAAIHGLRDIDGDGKEEVLLSLGTGYQLQPRGVLALDSVSGAKKWYYPVGPGITQVLMHDINRDASPDVLAMGYSLGNTNIAPDKTHDFASFLYALGGRSQPNWIKAMPVYHSGARIAVQDIDRDNTEEIVYSGYTAWQYVDKDMGVLAALSGLTGETESLVESEKSLDDKGLVVTNSVGTGLAEIAVGGREGIVRKYDHQLKPLVNYISTGAVSVMAGNDFSRTGKPDFFALTDNNKLLVLNNALELITDYEYPSGGREAAVLVSDLIPGGSNELVLVSDKAYVLSAATKPEDQFDVSYNVLNDLPSGQIKDLKKQNAAAAQVVIKNKTGREAHFRVRQVLHPGQEQLIEDVAVPASGEKQINLFPDIPLEIELTTVAYRIILDRSKPDGSYETVFTRETQVRIHPKSRFFPVFKDAAGKKLDLLASLVNWVDPLSPDVGKIVVTASQLGLNQTPPVKIVGPQPPGAFRGVKDERTLEQKDKDYLAQIGLAYAALEKLYAVTYKNAPLVLQYKAGVSQNILSPGETVRASGNCIDNAVLFASILERMEFRPLLVLLLKEGHVIVGWDVEGAAADGSPAHKYHFLDPNKFSPEIAFDKVLEAGQVWTDRQKLKAVLSGNIQFKDGVFNSQKGGAVVLDVAGIKQFAAD